MRINSIKTTHSILGMIFFSLLLGFQNCSNAKFTTDASSDVLNAVTGNNGGDDPTCSPTTATSNKIVKVLFVMDTSGSNAGESGSIPSDPNKTWRSHVLNDFISAYSSKSNFYYGLITFQGTSAKAQIKSGGSGIFSNSSSVVQAGVNSFMNTADSGNTPYKAALTMAKGIISADLAANSAQKAAYAVVMISDGQATDYRDPSDVIPDAQAIVNLAPSQVSLNTVYYYPTSFVDSQTKYLRNIATTGGGQFLIANSSATLKIDDAIQIPGLSCQ